MILAILESPEFDDCVEFHDEGYNRRLIIPMSRIYTITSSTRRSDLNWSSILDYLKKCGTYLRFEQQQIFHHNTFDDLQARWYFDFNLGLETMLTSEDPGQRDLALILKPIFETGPLPPVELLCELLKQRRKN